MTHRHPIWWVMPLLGIPLGILLQQPADRYFPGPDSATVASRVLVLPDGRGLRFLRGPDMKVFLSETEVPDGLWREFSSAPPSHADAAAFGVWLSTITGEALRLPTTAEWRSAARAGVPGAVYPWGFSPVPPDSLRFAKKQIPSRPGPAYGYGFRDLAGGRWEWTREGVALGGAATETDPSTLRIDAEWTPPTGYADHDMAVRLAWTPSGL